MGLLSAIQGAIHDFIAWTGVLYLFMGYLKPYIFRWLSDPASINHRVADAKGKTLNQSLVDGRAYPPFGVEHLRNTVNIRIRPDDVLLCGYPKTGCHWMFEIVSMLVKGEAKLSRYGKLVLGMYEAIPDIVTDSLPSPRVLNTHFLYGYIPTEARVKKTKIILTTRNPKDTLVSFYNHHRHFDFYGYDGEFADYFPLFMEGKLDYGDYFDFWLDWERVIKENKDHPILVMPYEDLLADTLGCVHKLAKFLEVPITEDFAKEVVSACEFQTMKAARVAESPAAGGVFRKGKVGDWRSWLTEDQSKAIDQRWEQKMKNCLYQPKM